jgi:hypothetical protein
MLIQHVFFHLLKLAKREWKVTRLKALGCGFSVLICVFAFLESANESKATLIIAMYNNDCIYLASDSLEGQTEGTNTWQVKKIYKISPTCAATINGNYGYSGAPQPNGGIPFYSFMNVFSNLCLNQRIDDTNRKIDAIYRGMHRAYYQLAFAINEKEDEQSGTRISFWGYDTNSKCFFGKSAWFDVTGESPLCTVFARGRTNIASNITFLGEDKFLPDLLFSDDAKLNPIRASPIYALAAPLLQSVQSGVNCSDEQMCNLMVAIFALHKTYAASNNPDEGHIGPPYVIYKIDKEKINKLGNFYFELR